MSTPAHHELMQILGFTLVEDSPDHRGAGVVVWSGHGLEIEVRLGDLETWSAGDLMAAVLAQAHCAAVAGHQQHLRRALGFDLAGNGFVRRHNPPSPQSEPARGANPPPNPLQTLAIAGLADARDPDSGVGVGLMGESASVSISTPATAAIRAARDSAPAPQPDNATHL